MAQSNFNCEVLLEIKTYDVDETHKLCWRIVSWNGGKPKLEFRPLHMKNGQWQNGQHLIKLDLPMLEQILDEKMLHECLKQWKKLPAQAGPKKDE